MKVLLLQHFESYWEGPLRDLHNTNFEEYYATNITGVVPVCTYCFKPRKFYQKKLTYIETCGASQCISKQRLEMYANMPEEQRAAISAKKREGS